MPTPATSTDLGLLRVFSFGLPRATRGPGGGCMDSGGGPPSPFPLLEVIPSFFLDFFLVVGLAVLLSSVLFLRSSADLDFAA